MHATLDHLTPANRRLLEPRLTPFDFDKFGPTLFRRCTIRLLLVTDALSFSPVDDFGLGTFVKVLLDTPIWGRVQITLANIGPFNLSHVDPSLTSEPRISARIENFRFDNAGQFDPSKFDAVFLFGISSFYGGGIRSGGTLDDSEIAVLNAFQHGGGGLFATGDHGTLGFALCSKVARARDMRWWESFPDANQGTDEVSMSGQRRNDTNVFGINVFNDQSDDIPQQITPRYYSRNAGIFRYIYPHPLLCGPKGVIRVMPDHPHEGQCKTPDSLDLTVPVGGAQQPEYPPATGGGARPVPEVISWNHVAAGRTSSGKDATLAQQFPGICAYDGHRAGVGRVVTDATWHHFVNVNLIGVDGIEPPDPFATGFLATPAGQAVFEEIKAYYRNIMKWLCRPATISCLRSSILIWLVLNAKVLEAVLSTQRVKFDQLSPKLLSLIGIHARDVLGRLAGQCQWRLIVIDLIEIDWHRYIDPWFDDPNPPDPPFGEIGDLGLIELSPMLDAVLGGALVAVAHEVIDQDAARLAKIKPEKLLEVARKGASVALDKSRESLARSLEQVQSVAFGERGKRTS